MPVPVGLPEVERQSLREVATDRIRAAIFDGSLEPGEHLNDQELQDWLGMSRTPIREALNDLARIGLIEMAPQKYTRVALPDEGQRVEVLQTVGAMYGGLVRVTVPALTDEQAAELIAEVERMITEVFSRQDREDAVAAAFAFMARFTVLCPNPTLVEATKDVLDGLAFQISANRTASAVVRWDRVDENYRALKAALEQRDAIAAELAVERIFGLSEEPGSGSTGA